jgi:hypothetical protein
VIKLDKMKFRLLSIASILFISNLGFAQPKDIQAPPEILLQLGNTSNVYHGTVTYANKGTGLLLDTTSNTTALYLQTCGYAFLTNTVKFHSTTIPVVNSDTLYPIPLNGNGMLSFFAKVWKVTGTDTMVITPVESFDDNGIWYPVPGLSAITLYPTSLTVPLEADWTVNSGYYPIIKLARHYGLKFVGNGSSTMGVIGYVRDYVEK